MLLRSFCLLTFVVISYCPSSVKAQIHNRWRHSYTACNSQCVPPDNGGSWQWVASQYEHQRKTVSLYNRYCVRCHGIDGRGVWDIPDVPNFADPAWQASRNDEQIARLTWEGRGAVMPSFRGTLTWQEAWALAYYIRKFVPVAQQAKPKPPGPTNQSLHTTTIVAPDNPTTILQPNSLYSNSVLQTPPITVPQSR